MKRLMILITLLGLVAFLRLNSGAAKAPKVMADREAGASVAETTAERDKRMRWWREARFGMFIHWGLYAVPAGEYKGKRIEGIGEWIMASADIPREDYEKFAAHFNPVKFDASAWVRTAQDAGMKYIVITSKHHDGFCLFDT